MNQAEIVELVARCGAAAPGERVALPQGASATATNEYMTYSGHLYRRFRWGAGGAERRLMWEEWMPVDGRWTELKKKAAG